MTPDTGLAFLFDVDNTLLDDDQVKADLQAWLATEFDPAAADFYRTTYESLRNELGYADFLGTFQRCWQDSALDPRWVGAARFLLDYPFADRLYHGALGALAAVRRLGPVAIVSDGDAVLQPRKIRVAGLAAAVDNVLIFQHKQRERTAILERVPARRHVMVDDKLEVLNAMKADWGERLATVFVRQGHYAREQRHRGLPAADFTIDHIGELGGLAARTFQPDAA